MSQHLLGVIARVSTLVLGLALGLVPGLGVLAPSVALAQTPSLTLVGMAPGTGGSRVYGLSADGRSASGYSQEETSGNTHYPGFRWNADTGRQDFGVGLAPALTLGYGISGDGATIVGGSYPSESGPSSAFRWSVSGGYQTLGTLSGFGQSEARDANHDGSVIVGTADNGNGTTPQAFRWTQGGGMQGLGAGTRALAISGNGSTIVGLTGPFGNRPFTWTPGAGLQFLPTLDGSISGSAAGINSDGSIIVGASGVELRGTMWINGAPMDLTDGSLTTNFGPSAVSDDGSIAAGQLNLGIGGLFAGVWTQTTGTMKLSDYLTANGVTIPAGMILSTCTAISTDGKTFAGWTRGVDFGVQGYVATIPSPGTLVSLGIGLAVAARRRR